MFRSHAEAQKETGLKNLKLMRDIDRPNIIICLFEIDDIENAKKFAQAPEANESKKIPD